MKKYNNRILWKMAVRSLKRNKAKNRMLLTAVILSVFLIFTVLTVGSTYMEMEKIQNIRLFLAGK